MRLIVNFNLLTSSHIFRSHLRISGIVLCGFVFCKFCSFWNSTLFSCLILVQIKMCLGKHGIQTEMVSVFQLLCIFALKIQCK